MLNPQAQIFKQAVQISRRFAKRKPRRKRLPKRLQPKAIEREYYRQILELLAEARELVAREVEPLLPELAREAASLRRDAARADASRISEVMDRISETFFSRLRPAAIEELAGKFAARTITWDKEQMSRQVKAAFGVDVFAREPQLRPLTERFTDENIGLIKSIPNKFFDDIENKVLRAVGRGATAAQLQEELDGAVEGYEKRTALIARDQIGKFYGALNEKRQTAMGIEEYVWRTSNDSRVRDSHAAREGQVFRWDDPPDGGNPGAEINCRCFGEPILAPLLGGGP